MADPPGYPSEGVLISMYLRAGLEPATPGLNDRCSFHLSYHKGYVCPSVC